MISARTVACTIASLALSGCLMATTAKEGTTYGSHFDGMRFYNVPDRDHSGFGELIAWQLSRDQGPWDEPRDDLERGDAPPAKVGRGRARVTFVNHATVLIQIGGLNILTDPIYAERASPLSWIGPRRVRPPGIAFEDLPKIHAVLVSHDHYDHLCLETLERLHERDQPVIFTGLGNGATLRGLESPRVVELDWWQSAPLANRAWITFVPAQHFSMRGACDRNSTLWGGFVITARAGRIYFAGDTGAGPHFADIGEHLGPLDLALLPIGASRPRTIMKPIHLSPEDAVVAHRQLGARRSMAIHFGTFALGDDGQHEPVERLNRALDRAGMRHDDFWVLDHGAGRDVPLQGR